MRTSWPEHRRKANEEMFNSTNWTEIQMYYDADHSYRDTAQHFNLPACRLDKAIKLGLFKRRDQKTARAIVAKRPRRPMSAQGRANCSAAKQKWNRENPELLRQHMIRRAENKNRSVPCERVKNWLRTRGIVFEGEFLPLLHKGRYYSMDIAFPDRMVGVEINGNQHYNRDGSLAPYYQTRHDSIVAEGWTLYEWHYPICFKDDELVKAFEAILSVAPIVQFDYGAYRSLIKPKKIKGLDKRKGPQLHRRHPNRPDKTALQQLVWLKPIVHIAKDLNCGWGAIIKWCFQDGISTPPQGYWQRRNMGKTHEEALMAPVKPPAPRRIVGDILRRVINLRQLGKKWAAIGREVGFGRHYVKRAYLKWYNQRESNPHEDLRPSTFAG